jgi:mannose-6-phosphate isomerase-like protein (cupin superfamily)
LAEESGYYYEALAYKKSKKNMEPFLVEFRRKKPEKLFYFSHDGEEFIYLLEGVLEFRTENQQYVLYPGDSLYFESSIPHAYRALEKKNARALTVVYPTRLGLRKNTIVSLQTMGRSIRPTSPASRRGPRNDSFLSASSFKE